jgi:hypothetical protein
MRINIIEKFGLYERLSDLSKSLNEHEESQNICNKAIHDLKSGFTSNKFNLYMEQLKKYEWIAEVEGFVASIDTFMNENKYGLELERIMNKLEGIKTYNPIVESIKALVTEEEDTIKSNIPSLAKFKFEPNVKRVIENFESAEFNVQKTDVATITSSPISAIMQVDEGFIFAANSGNYMVSSSIDKITKYDGQVSKEFQAAKNALNLFKYKGDNTFEANLPKARIQIIAGENGNTATINESVIENKTQLTNVLKTAGLVNYTDTKTRSIVEFMYEKAGDFVEIDFAKSVETINENFEVFKMANNDVSVAKFNKKTRGFVLESLDLEDIEELSESLKSNYALDFNNILEGLQINVESLEFKSLVENININTIVDMTKTDEIYSKIDEAHSKYNELGEDNQKNVETEFEQLSVMESKLKSEEVLFLVETKKALVEKLDESEELTKSIEMLNEELSTLVVEKKVSEKDAKKKLEQIRKSLRKEDLSYGEIAELEGLAEFIEDDDIELRQAAGLPE